MSDTMSLFDADGVAQPRARVSDPSTAHRAAEILKPGNEEQVKAVREAVIELGPSTAWEIAAEVRKKHGNRWQSDSIRSCCARAGLEKLARWGESPGRRPASLYRIAIESVDVKDGLV